MQEPKETRQRVRLALRSTTQGITKQTVAGASRKERREHARKMAKMLERAYRSTYSA